MKNFGEKVMESVEELSSALKSKSTFSLEN